MNDQKYDRLMDEMVKRLRPVVKNGIDMMTSGRGRVTAEDAKRVVLDAVTELLWPD